MRKQIVLALAGVLTLGMALAVNEAQADIWGGIYGNAYGLQGGIHGGQVHRGRGVHHRGHGGVHGGRVTHLRTPGVVYAPRHIPRYGAFRGHGRAHLDFHDTSHYDFVGPRVVRHGRHVHVKPGTYRLHREGHYDVHVGPHRRGPYGY